MSNFIIVASSLIFFSNYQFCVKTMEIFSSKILYLSILFRNMPPTYTPVTSLVTHSLCHPQVLIAPHPQQWYDHCPRADEISITDVIFRNVAVTIRECKTKEGFFKEDREFL